MPERANALPFGSFRNKTSGWLSNIFASQLVPERDRPSTRIAFAARSPHKSTPLRAHWWWTCEWNEILLSARGFRHVLRSQFHEMALPRKAVSPIFVSGHLPGSAPENRSTRLTIMEASPCPPFWGGLASVGQKRNERSALFRGQLLRGKRSVMIMISQSEHDFDQRKKFGFIQRHILIPVSFLDRLWTQNAG